MEFLPIEGAVTVTNAVILAIIIGLQQVIKKFIPERLWAVSPLVLGVAFSGFSVGWNFAGIVTGIALGLMASGLYDQKQIVKSV